MKNYIPIVFATNDNYIKPTLTCIISILENKNKDTSYEFNIMHSGLKKENIDILNNYVSKNNASINFINVSEYIKNINFDDFMRIDDNYNYITGETFYRFFMPSLFKDYNKMIYLDGDTIVTNDLTELFNTNIKGYYLAGVRDLYIMSQAKHMLNWNLPTVSTNQTLDIYLKEVLDIQDLKYFNAGVLIFNLEEMRKDDIENKLLKYAQSHLHLEYQDQDILNAVCRDKIKELSLKYNKTSFPQLNRDKKKFCINFNKLEKETVIIHYADYSKPWNSQLKIELRNLTKNHHLWWKYYRKSPLYKKEDEYIVFTKTIVTFILYLYVFFENIYWELNNIRCLIHGYVIKGIYWHIIMPIFWNVIMGFYWHVILPIFWNIIMGFYWHVIMGFYWRVIKPFYYYVIMGFYWHVILPFYGYVIVGIYCHIILPIYWHLRHLFWLIFVKYIFRSIKKLYRQVIKKFINRIIKTAIKHTKRLLNI